MATHVVTLANSIVGVSVLAMPFCFKYCGVFLATLMLVLSAIMTRIVCYFLLKAGVMTKRRSYEMLAYHTFGHGGKFMVEVTLIGFLVGTLIAFLVVIGDLGPPIVAEIFNVENNHSLRTVVMTGLALFVALPLGLLRDIESLGSVSTISFLFYLFLVLKILSEGLEVMEDPIRLEGLSYWKPSGVLQCIPIISMALSCQTQIFSIYDSLPDQSVHRMNEVVKKAVYLCTSFYFCVGFFGYLAFSTEGITGNILMSFGDSWTTQFIKICFVLSIALSVPLCVFPCRASLYSLLFKRAHSHHSLHDISTNYIPDGKLRLLTVLIVGSTLVIALLIPNIELVLGLVGSTAGSIICLILPSAMFIKVTPKKTTERLLAQGLLVAGICIMILTTYATLYAVEQSQAPVLKQPVGSKVVDPRVSPDEVIVPHAKVLENDLPVIKEENIVSFEPKKTPKLVPPEEKIPPALPELPAFPVVDSVKEQDKAEVIAPAPAPAPVSTSTEPPLLPPLVPIVEKPQPEVTRDSKPIQEPSKTSESEPIPKEVEPMQSKVDEKPKEPADTKQFLEELKKTQQKQQELIEAQQGILDRMAKHQELEHQLHQNQGQGDEKLKEPSPVLEEKHDDEIKHQGGNMDNQPGDKEVLAMEKEKVAVEKVAEPPAKAEEGQADARSKVVEGNLETGHENLKIEAKKSDEQLGGQVSNQKEQEEIPNEDKVKPEVGHGVVAPVPPNLPSVSVVTNAPVPQPVKPEMK